MRILTFTTYFRPFEGGAEVALRELTRHLPDIRFDIVTARCRRDLPRVETDGNVTVYRVGIGIRADKYLISGAGHDVGVELTRRHEYAAILSVMASYAGLAAVRIRARLHSIPLLLNLQEGRDFAKNFGVVRHRLFSTIVSQSDHIVAISRYLASIAERFGARSAIDIIPNGVDLARFGALRCRASLTAVRQRIGVENDEDLIISTSRFAEKNGLEHLIRALPSILERRQVKLLLMGSGPLANRLRLVAHSLGVASRVILHPPLDHEKLVHYLAAADLFVRPSLSEGFGNSFIEAMAAGVPIVATNVGGIADFLRPGVNGMSCEPSSPPSVAEAVLRVLDDPALRSRLVESGRATAAEYNWTRIAAAYRHLLLRLSG